ncbi:MAG: Voldacs domain-containing protein [Terracidiphilus sp.]|nr:Voldacs domain-containing protein [Terracidiphilus sp.]
MRVYLSAWLHRRVIWMQDSLAVGYSMAYASIGMHAVARDPESFDRPCLLCEVCFVCFVCLCVRVCVCACAEKGFVCGLCVCVRRACLCLCVSAQLMSEDDCGGNEEEEEDEAPVDPTLSTQIRFVPADPSIRRSHTLV